MDARLNERGNAESDFVQEKLVQFSELLKVLVESQQYASDLSDPRCEFAMRITEAERYGARIHDLRWLVRRGLIEHLPYHDSQITDEIDSNSRFVISATGLALLQRNFEDPHDDDLTFTVRPKWHHERHELTLRGKLVKRFRWPAANQETVIAAFDEEGWPARIDDPLPQVSNLDPKRRLGDTIKCLNRNQCERRIRFRGDGTGEGVLWDTVSGKCGPRTIGFQRFGENPIASLSR